MSAQRRMLRPFGRPSFQAAPRMPLGRAGLMVTMAIALSLLPIGVAHGQVGQSDGVSSGRSESAGTVTSLPRHRLDMGTLGIAALSPGQTLVQAPRNGAVAPRNAYLRAAPSVAPPSTDAAVGIVGSSFAPAENVKVFLNGSFAATLAADGNGRLGASINTSVGQGYVTVEAVGQTSGKRAGTAFAVSAQAPSAPGLAVAPSAINPTGSSSINLLGVGYPPSTEVTIYRNGVERSSVTTDSEGVFYVGLSVAATADTSAVYTAGTAAAGSLAGQSVEERGDAGTPPAGDESAPRAYLDRPIIPSVAGVTPLITGEGFEPGESVHLGGCGSAYSDADANGAVAWLMYLPSGPATTRDCSLYGATSLRYARTTAQIDSRTLNVPSAINSPGTLASGGRNFWFLFSRLPANESGVVYIDGIAQASYTTGSHGQGAIHLTAPNAAGIHAVQFVASQSSATAIAPLYITSADTVPPSVTAPVTVVPYDRQLSARKVPLRISWSASDPSGVSLYQLQQSRNGGSWSEISLPSATTTELTLRRAPGNTYRYRVRATDAGDRTSAWAAGPTFRLVARQEKSAAIAYRGLWTTRSISTAYRGAVKYAKSGTARATFTFTGTSVAWVAPLGSKRGVADVYVDGSFAATVYLRAGTAHARMTVFARSWPSVGTHTVEIRVRGITEWPRVDIDAFVFTR